MSRLVVIESPYKAKTEKELERNVKYARACMRDCFMKREYPFASHLLYTQKGVLDDNNHDERKLGIEAGLAWVKIADATIVYTDFGITDGMRQGVERAKDEEREIKYRKLFRKG